MAKLIVIESSDIENPEHKATNKQLDYIRGLMKSEKLEKIYLDHIAQYANYRLSKMAASKLIDILLKHEEFEIRQLKD